MEVDSVSMQLDYLEAIAGYLGIKTQECRGDIGKLVYAIEIRANAIFAQGLFDLTSNPPLSIVTARSGLNDLITKSGLTYLKSSPMVGVIRRVNSKQNITIPWSRRTKIAGEYLKGEAKRHGITVGIRGPGRHSLKK